MILAIDTSAAQCAVALADPSGAVLARRAEPMQRGHAERLMPMIEAVLAEAGAARDRLARVAVCTGPGSFTGVRVGVAAARGIALGLGIPAVGISRFDALAAAARARGPVAVALAGPRGQVYLLRAGGAGEGATRLLAAGALEAALLGGVPCIGDAAPGAVPEDGLADPAAIAALAAGAVTGAPPAPLYLRGPQADPPREAPPAMLD
jgi:tRNA threonylcarbamoyl adenosine modification protein YeaZ